MCCVLVLVSFFLPRLAIFLSWLLSDYIPNAYTSRIWPLLGFFFMPYTTLAYAMAMHGGGLKDFWLIVFVLAVLADLGVIGSARQARRRRGRIEVIEHRED